MDDAPRAAILDAETLAMFRAPTMLTETMFPPEERSGWYSSLDPYTRETEAMFGRRFSVWFQEARCTACGDIHGISQVVGNGLDEAQALAVIATFAGASWRKLTMTHLEECANRRLWRAMIAANPPLARYFAEDDEAMEAADRESR